MVTTSNDRSTIARLVREPLRQVLILAIALVLVGSLVARLSTSASAATPKVSYTYDADGRLASVTNAAGDTATYTYDAEGNITAITRTTASKPKGKSDKSVESKAVVASPRISSVAPRRTHWGRTVEVKGSGFTVKPSSDLVRIGQLQATVLHSTRKELVVAVPPDGGGSVRVRTPAGLAVGPRVAIAGAPKSNAPAAARSRHHAGAPHGARGVTSLAGLVETSSGKALSGIRISISNSWGATKDTTSATTDRRGWFLLTDLSPGSHVLRVDGGDTRYGVYSESVVVDRGRTTVLPWTTFLTPLAHAVTIASPTAAPVTLTSPDLPGLSVRIPAGTVITDASGHVVHEVSLTRLPTGRTPFPWAVNMDPPYFTLQPGDATVSGPGISVDYANTAGLRAGSSVDYLVHDSSWSGSGWRSYPSATVSANGKTIVANVTYHQIEPGGYPANSGPGTGPAEGSNATSGEPVDLGTGLYVLNATDLVLPDSTPVTLGRTYREDDDTVRDFGLGMSSSFNYYIVADSNGDASLFEPNGGAITYTPSTTTNGLFDAVGTPTGFAGSTLTQETSDPDGPYVIDFPNGTTWTFSNPAFLIQITDHFGNTIHINRNDYEPVGSGGGEIESVTSPDGQWMKFTYGDCVSGTNTQCITSVADDAGQTLSYTYDAYGRMTSVTGPNGGVTNYAWAPCTSTLTCTEMLSGTDPDGDTFVTNTYDPTSGRVTQQEVADGGIWKYAYFTSSSGAVDETNVTNPLGTVDEYTFNANGYESGEVLAQGTSVQQTVTPVYDSTTNFLDSYTDALGRETTYTYNADGSVLTETQNAGTSSPQTTTYTYEPKYDRLASVTNALGKTTTYTYDDSVPSITQKDALGNSTVTTLNKEGLPIQVTDAEGNSSYYSYLNNHLVAYANPNGDVTSYYNNSLGLPLETTDADGNVTGTTWNSLDELSSETDPTGGTTTDTYDADGNLTAVEDADGNTTSFAYDTSGRPISEKDALGHSSTLTYDLMGDVLSSTDRDGNASDYAYDAIGRLTSSKSGVSGSSDYDKTTFTYDAGNRLTKEVDTLAGTYSYTYDDLNDVLSAKGPVGTLKYTYSTVGQETSMDVSGQPTVTYAYNADGNPSSVTQGSSTVAYKYDADQDVTGITLPDGITESATYAADSQVSGLSYADGSTSLGSLTFAYDPDGLETSASGSLASTNLPAAVSSATYNADNELTDWGSTALTYDDQGNLLTDGSTTFSWNPENELASVSGGSQNATYTYAPSGQRQSETVGSTTTSFLYDGMNVVQTDSSGTATANMLTAPRYGTFQVSNSAGTSSLLTDQQNSTIALGSSTGTSATQYTYDPFGATTSSGSTNPNSNQYIGAQDDATGLYYLNNRYYDPAIDRFVSQDPAGLSGGTTDLYQYSSDDPINLSDPSGLAAPAHPSGATALNAGLNLAGGLLTAAGIVLFFVAPELEIPALIIASAGYATTLGAAATQPSSVNPVQFGADTVGFATGVAPVLVENAPPWLGYTSVAAGAVSLAIEAPQVPDQVQTISNYAGDQYQNFLDNLTQQVFANQTVYDQYGNPAPPNIQNQFDNGDF